MQIYGFFSNAGTARATTAGSPTGIDAAPLAQNNGSSLLNLLRVDDETAANRKAVAKKKLDELKEQLQMLRFWASDPETLARLAKQLAQQLGAAAQQFAGGGSAGMAGGGDAPAGAAAQTTAWEGGAGSACQGRRQRRGRREKSKHLPHHLDCISRRHRDSRRDCRCHRNPHERFDLMPHAWSNISTGWPNISAGWYEW